MQGVDVRDFQVGQAVVVAHSGGHDFRHPRQPHFKSQVVVLRVQRGSVSDLLTVTAADLDNEWSLAAKHDAGVQALPLGRHRRPRPAFNVQQVGVFVLFKGLFQSLAHAVPTPGKSSDPRIRALAVRGFVVPAGLGVGSNRFAHYFFGSSLDNAAMKASWGTSTRPMAFMRFLPAFCFSNSLRFRLMSPP